MSQGTPTSLVRDRGIEGSNPVEAAPFKLTPTAIEAEGVHDGSDQRRSDDASRQPPPDVERYKTMAFDTMARPALWPVPGVEADYDSPKESKRRRWGYCLVVLGVFAIVGGFYLIQIPALPTHRFVPSSTELHVLSNGGTAIPPDCSRQVARSVTNEGLGLQVAPGDANTEFTAYPHSVILLYGYENSSPEVSSEAPLCNLDSTDVGSSTEVTYFLERPGDATVYFVDSAAHISVIRIVITASPPPSSLPGWIVLILGVLVLLSGAVVFYRRNRGRPSDDLRRADDGGITGTFDPQMAERAALDALDQSSGQL